MLGCIFPGVLLLIIPAPHVCRLIADRSSNKMPTGVRAALADIAREEGGMGEEEAHAYIAQIEKEERLFEECWS